MEHKKQHWVPRSYLEAWTDPATPEGQHPYVWRFPKDGGPGERKAPKNIFHETDMYTVRRADGSRDLTLEHGLAGLESEFASIRREKLENFLELDDRERLLVCGFIAAMQGRTQQQRDHFQAQWSGVVEDMDALMEAVKKTPPEERKRKFATTPPTGGSKARLTYEDVQRLADAPLQNMLGSIINIQAPILYGMDLAVLSTDDEVGFITSDAPCVWSDPEAHKRQFFRTPGLWSPTIEVTLPASPNQLIILNRRDFNGYYRVGAEGVHEANRTSRAHARDHFVVRKNETKEIWYDLGRPPETS